MPDRLVREDRPHHHQQARRDQHAETGAAADQAERVGGIVAVAPHLRIGDGRERRGRRHARAGHESEDDVSQDGRIGEAPRQPLDTAVHRPEHVARHARAGDELAHQEKQRHDREEIFAQGLVGRAADEVQAQREILGGEIERKEADDAQTDRDLDASEYQEEQKAEEEIGCEIHGCSRRRALIPLPGSRMPAAAPFRCEQRHRCARRTGPPRVHSRRRWRPWPAMPRRRPPLRPRPRR